MVARNRVKLFALVAGLLAWTAAFAQSPMSSLPPSPIPAPPPGYTQAPAPLLPVQQAPVTLGAPAQPQSTPPAPYNPPPPPQGPYAPPPAPYNPPPQAPYTPPPLFAPVDPGRDGWGPYGLPSAFPTLFFGVDLYFLQPSIKGNLRGDMPLDGGGTRTFTTPGSNLDFTVSPRFVAGWRLPDSTGEFSFSYRFIATQGTGDINTDSGPLSVRTRLNANIFDFDYTTSRYAFLPRWNAQWWFGARLETVFYDHQGADSSSFQESASNYFVGAGPHAGVQVDREISLLPGLAVFGRLDGAVAVGQVRQRFGETVPVGGGSLATTNFNQDRTQSSPNLTLQAGLSYHPPQAPFLHFQAGFQYERFWEVGKDGSSTGDIQNYGGFLGAVFDY